MAATGNEFVLLRQLKIAINYFGKAISALLTEISTLKTGKLDAPKSSGTDGYVLVYDGSGNQWVDPATLSGVKTATDEDAKAFFGY